MTEYVTAGGLKVAQVLHELVANEIAPGTGVEPETVWKTLGAIVAELGPRNQALLDRRDALQSEIDAWFRERQGKPIDGNDYRAFLESIGYLLPEGDDFKVTTANVDAEIAELAGPQLVVPVDKARYALNAANARWGSLYDALYGTDVIESDGSTTSGYDPARGEKVIAWTNRFLDEAVPLASGQWSDVVAVELSGSALELTLANERGTALADTSAFVGFKQQGSRLTSVLLRHHGLHIDIEIDPSHPIGRQHPAGIKDVVLESAITTIMDCEDSVAAVDAEDKALVYSNWNGIMR
ncbi:MAG: malate synthase G, partial [Gammaproteobacteria bacterium]|nr:malate synthase G [Gammaproteobacteria bacterium]